MRLAHSHNQCNGYINAQRGVDAVARPLLAQLHTAVAATAAAAQLRCDRASGVCHAAAAGQQHGVREVLEAALQSSHPPARSLQLLQPRQQSKPQAGGADGPEEQQQQQQLLLQRIASCRHWQQLLPLAADAASLAAAPVLTAVLVRAAQLPPERHWAAATASASSATQPAAAAGSPPADTAAAAAAMPAATAGLLDADHTLHENLQHQRFLQHLINLVASNLAAGLAGRGAAAAAATLSPQQLAAVLTQLSSRRLQPQPQLQALLARHLSSHAHGWQREELLQVLVAVARLQPAKQWWREVFTPQLQQQLLQQVTRQPQPQPSQQQQQQGRGCQPATQQPVQAVAATLWVTARLKWAVDQQLLQGAAVQVLQQLRECSAADLACALWALAKLDCNLQQLQQQPNQQQQGHGARRPGTPLQQRPVANPAEQLLAAVAERVDGFSAQELCCVLWAVARLQLQPQPQLVLDLLQRCQQPTVLCRYTDVDLACLLHSLSRIQQQTIMAQQQLESHQELQQYKRRQQQKQQQQHKSRPHSSRPNSSDSDGNGFQLVSLAAVEPLLQALQVLLPASHIHYVCRALWAVSSLGLQPREPWVSRVLYHVQLLMPQADLQSLVYVVSGVADLRFLPSPAWLSSFYAATEPLLLAAATQLPGPQGAASAPAAPAAPAPASCSMVTELTVLVSAVHKISRSRNQHFPGQKPPVAWLDALAQVSVPLLPQLSPHALALWGLAMRRFSSLSGQPWPGPGRDWWASFAACSEPLLAAAAPWDLCNIGFVLSKQKQHGPPPDSWVRAFVEATRGWLLPPPAAARSGAPGGSRRDRRPAAAAADLVDYGKLLAGLGVLPDAAWRQQWLLAVEAVDAQMTPQLSRSLSWTRRTFRDLEQGTAAPSSSSSSSSSKHAGDDSDEQQGGEGRGR